MSELGQQLQAAREDKGLSLADIENQLKIRRPILQALENGHSDELPPVAFTRGLVRKYATFLELDAGLAVERFEKEYGVTRPTVFTPVLQEPLYRRGRDWSDLALTAGVAVLFAIAVLFVWQNYIAPLRQSPRPPTTTASGGVVSTSVAASGTVSMSPVSEVALQIASPTPVASQPAPTRTPVLEPTPALGPAPTITLLPTIGATNTPQPPTPAPTTPSNEVEVAVEITQPSWIQVTVDGRQVFAAILQPGQNRAWRGQRSVVLRTGNAGGTIIFVNGQAVGTLGTPGAVVEREWQLGQGDVIMLQPGQAPPPTWTPNP